MNAEIISVGTELLLGQVVNTDAAIVAQELSALGISLLHTSVVGDNPQRLKDAVETALARSDLLIMTGGLGPTTDDLTKETTAAAAGKKLVLHPESLDRINNYFNGALMTEIIFSYPGIGTQVQNAILQSDYNMIEGTITLSIISISTCTLIADLVYPFIDPRIRYA